MKDPLGMGSGSSVLHWHYLVNYGTPALQGSMAPAGDPSQWRGVGFKITSHGLVQSKSLNSK